MLMVHAGVERVDVEDVDAQVIRGLGADLEVIAELVDC